MTRCLTVVALLAVVAAAPAAEPAAPSFDHKRDVIYGRKFGMCLTMDVFSPKANPNGAGVIVAVSGGWVSSHDAIRGLWIFTTEFIKRGYTVFAVVHGSQPKFTVPECVEDMHRAVRFIRHNAKTFGIDPGRIGVTGASAGCHLSLMLAVGGKDGDPKARDPIDRESSRVQAVAGFFPPTDFFNYGEPGKDAGEVLRKYGLALPFDFRDLDPKKGSAPVSTEKRNELMKKISPTYHVSDKTAPVLIVHGDKDVLVPIQQARVFIDRMKEHKVPAELVVKEGLGHTFWAGFDKDIAKIADWFDTQLAKKSN